MTRVLQSAELQPKLPLVFKIKPIFRCISRTGPGNQLIQTYEGLGLEASAKAIPLSTSAISMNVIITRLKFLTSLLGQQRTQATSWKSRNQLACVVRTSSYSPNTLTCTPYIWPKYHINSQQKCSE